MEFRTVKRNGILLSLSDIHEYPALTLEINDGQVNGNVLQALSYYPVSIQMKKYNMIVLYTKYIFAI